MLLIFAIALFTIAVYMGLDAITVRQKQVAGSLARARRYGGASVRESELTKDVTNRVLAPDLPQLLGKYRPVFDPMPVGVDHRMIEPRLDLNGGQMGAHGGLLRVVTMARR